MMNPRLLHSLFCATVVLMNAWNSQAFLSSSFTRHLSQDTTTTSLSPLSFNNNNNNKHLEHRIAATRQQDQDIDNESSTGESSASTSTTTTTTHTIESAMALLVRAAETKQEDSDAVVEALLDLEKLQRIQNKEDPTNSQRTLEALTGFGGNGGSWRLIFTTGTVNTQKRTGTRINYFPIKAVQSFKKSDTDNDEWLIENGIYAGDFPLVLFSGDFDWTLQKSGVTKLTFDFTKIKLLGFLELTLKRGEAASIGAASGLGSESNVALEKQGKRAFFNWISADDKIATARGGGGGLALWKRVDYQGGQ